MTRLLLPQVEAMRITRLLSVSQKPNGDLQIDQPPPTKSSGLYWIYTNFPQNELGGCQSCGDKGAIDISMLATLHQGLARVCTIQQNGFSLVYNGVAGNKCGLRERIYQHFNGEQGTGCLSIKNSSLDDLARWRVTYVTLQVGNQGVPDVPARYATHAKSLERIWRLQYAGHNYV